MGGSLERSDQHHGTISMINLGIKVMNMVGHLWRWLNHLGAFSTKSDKLSQPQGRRATMPSPTLMQEGLRHQLFQLLQDFSNKCTISLPDEMIQVTRLLRL